MKNKVIMSYNKTLFWLSLILLVAFYFILRGSSWPLFIDSSLMRFLFYSSPEADHTLYNIAISYLAAYVFYLIQIYLPESKKTKTAIVQTRLDMINCLRQSKYFIEGWKEYTVRDNDKGAIIGVNKSLIYYEDYQGHIIQMTPRFLEETVGRILEEYDKIKNYFLFLQSDIELQKLFLEMDFAEQAHEWYKVLESAEMLCANPNSTILESFSPYDVQEFENRLTKLATVYGITEYILSGGTLWEALSADYFRRISLPDCAA